MKKIIFLLSAMVMLFLAGCSNSIQYSRFTPISSQEWNMDSLAQFDYLIEDTMADYQMLIYVRHTEQYPYQNMWLFVDDAGRQDTIEFYLADDRGRWLGDKHHGFIEMPVLYESNYHFPDTGKYCISVQQGMRDSVLRGVMDIGVEIVKGEK